MEADIYIFFVNLPVGWQKCCFARKIMSKVSLFTFKGDFSFSRKGFFFFSFLRGPCCLIRVLLVSSEMRDFYRSIRLKFSVIRSRPLLRDWDLSRELEKQLLRAGTKHNLETDQLADFRPYPLPNPAHSQIIYSPNVFGFHLFSFDT